MTQKSGPIDVSSKIIALSSSSFLIDEYVLPSNSDFVFQVTATIKDNSAIAPAVKTLNYRVDVSDLVITFAGVSELIDVGSDTLISSTVRDIDLLATEDLIKDYTFAWEVIDNNNDAPALDALTKFTNQDGADAYLPLVMPGNNQNFTIKSGQLMPFHTYTF